MKARDMSVSKVGVDLVKHFEGCYLNAYQDVVGVWTIGYGNTQRQYAYRGNVITKEKAEQLLANDLDSHMEVPKRDLTGDMNQNQYDALCSFAFNLGSHIFRNNRNLLDAINSGNWDEASRIMNLFVNAGGKPYAGLIRRRKAETELMLKPMKEQEKVQEHSQEQSGYDSSWFTKQDGVFTADRAIKVRKEPSVNSEHIRTLSDGGEYTYNSYGYEAYGYVWLKGVDGTYIASGETSNGERVSKWGSFR
jgi:GH24 family phage-related lysozyme (muramidase)